MSELPPLDLEGTLNTEQLPAVTHGEGPQLVLAGAGSGKTRVITYRIAWLVRERHVPPYRIAAVTFTNKAAREMQERVEALLGGRSGAGGSASAGATKGLYVGTFHRYALILLRRYGSRLSLSPGFGVVDSDDQLRLVKQALQAEQLAESAFPPRAVLSRISAAKSRLIGAETFEAEADGFFERRIAPVYHRYQALLRERAGVDFDDLLLLAVRLLREEDEIGERVRSRLEYLLVDEFQDTNHAQLELVHALVGSQGSLTAVGDEDQSIYRWRGAELENILEFENSFPRATVRKLERNYRSTQTILDASGTLIAHNQGRRGKRLWTDTGPGERIELYRARDEGDEATWLINALRGLHGEYRYRDMAILVRTNAQTRALEDELLRRGIPYSLVAGVRFYDRAEVKDLIAYLRLLQHPRDNLSLLRVLNRPARGIGDATQKLLEEAAGDVGHTLWDALKLDRLGGVPARGARALQGFRVLIERLREAARELPLPELLERVLAESGLAELYRGDDAETTSRRENLGEVLSAAENFVSEAGLSEMPALAALAPDDEREEAEEGAAIEVSPLVGFLDHVALVSDVDGLDREKGISLMTLHAAKGLEFPVVAIGGLEEGLLPHFNSSETREGLEEERRLLYVGMTRAQRRLFLATCRRRRVAGRFQDREESPFLHELPAETLELHESPSLFAETRAHPVHRFFGGPAEDPLPVYEVEDTRAVGRLGKGSRVRHATLGEGVVLELDGDGESAKITVYFQSSGKRRLVAKYAGLELL